MSIREILVVVDNGQGANTRIEFAATFAERIGARLTGLYARPNALPYAVGFPDGGLSGELIAEMERLDAEQEIGAHAVFASVTKKHDIEIDWTTDIGDPVTAIATSSRYTDLVITAQRDSTGIQTANWMPAPESIIARSARAGLVLPFSKTAKSEMKNILIAWNASREASRAVHEAMPLLKAADHVTVAVVNAQTSSSGHGADPGVDITRYLARHDVHVDLQRLSSGEADPAEQLLQCAFEVGADLLVAGCSGHSRVTEFLLSGTTRELLKKMTLPILMAH